MNQKIKDFFQRFLNPAGIRINGKRPWDLQVHNDGFYDRVLKQGSLGLGESYMDSWWDCESLDEFFNRVIKADLGSKIRWDLKSYLFALKNILINQQRKSKAREVGQSHYDLGNDLYAAMLDPSLSYSCGYWSKAQNLAQAQEAKLELICRKLNLKAGDDVLDIGGGWGNFARYAAKKYGVHVDVVTVSRKQVELGKKLCADLDVCFLLQDYREIQGFYNHIISVGMIEHVGYKNYRTYMQTVADSLKDDGLFLLHTIGRNKSTRFNDRWIAKYSFVNSMLPSMRQLSKAIENLFVLEDLHSFGADYDRTLMVWFANFEKNWPDLREKYGDRFYRQWKYYLLSCAGAFRARKNQVWQIVLSKNGVPGGYRSVR